MKLHRLGIRGEYLEQILLGRRTFEVRKLSHGIEPGDLICFRNIDDAIIDAETCEYVFRVVYALTDPRFCKPGYGIYAIKRMRPEGEEV